MDRSEPICLRCVAHGCRAPSTYYKAKSRLPVGAGLPGRADLQDNYCVYAETRAPQEILKRAADLTSAERAPAQAIVTLSARPGCALMRAAGIEGMRHGRRGPHIRPAPAAVRHRHVGPGFRRDRAENRGSQICSGAQRGPGVAYVCFIANSFRRMIDGRARRWPYSYAYRDGAQSHRMARWSRGKTWRVAMYSDAGSTSIRWGERLARLDRRTSLSRHRRRELQYALAVTVNDYYKYDLLDAEPERTSEASKSLNGYWAESSGTTPAAYPPKTTYRHRIRGHVRRYDAERPTRGGSPVAWASIRTRAIHSGHPTMPCDNTRVSRSNRRQSVTPPPTLNM